MTSSSRLAPISLVVVAAVAATALAWLVWPQPSRQLIDRTGLVAGDRCEVHGEPFVIKDVEAPDPAMDIRSLSADPALAARLFPHASVDVRGNLGRSEEGLLPLVRGKVCEACGEAVRHWRRERFG